MNDATLAAFLAEQEELWMQHTIQQQQQYEPQQVQQEQGWFATAAATVNGCNRPSCGVDGSCVVATTIKQKEEQKNEGTMKERNDTTHGQEQQRETTRNNNTP